MASIEVRVRSAISAGELCSITFAHASTVHELKAEIARRLGVPSEEQRLVLGTRVMREASQLADLVPEGESVEVMLVRAEQSEEERRKQAGKRMFESYLSHPLGHAKNRWDFHHRNVHTETDLDRGCSKNKRLYVKMQQDSNRAVTFSLCSLDFPLRELFDTFAEQSGVPVTELRFSFQGRRLVREDTPHLCGMEPCASTSAAHVIEVTRADSMRHRQRLFASLNRKGDAVKLAPSATAAVPIFPLGADILLKALLFVETEDLLNTTSANTFWFHATQRLSLLLQLRHGDVAFVSAPPQEYKAWLSNLAGHSQHLALADAQNRHKEVELWQALNMSKEKVKARKAYTFTKAAGCTEMKTVAIKGLSAEFEQQWLSLHSCKVKFMADCKQRSIDVAESAEHADSDSAQQQSQALPPLDSQNFTAEAVSPEFRAVAVELFRRYFSPDMYFIFPLIVNQEAAFGLDFRTTTTTLFFGPQSSKQKSAAPAGACSWRFRWPLLKLESDHMKVARLEQPCSVLEVLFIAVWEEERDQVHGGTLVEELEKQARAAGVKMLYVEIGYEQPKARRFWRKQGFRKVVRRNLSEAESEELVAAEDQEVVPMLLERVSDAQMAFFESNCLRFGDTAQYVKLLE